MIDAEQIIAAVVLIVASEDVEVIVKSDVVDVSQPTREEMEAAPVWAASEDAAPLEPEPVSFRPCDVAAAVAKGQIEPAVIPGDHAVRAVEPIGRLLRGQTQTGQQVDSHIGDSVARRVL